MSTSLQALFQRRQCQEKCMTSGLKMSAWVRAFGTQSLMLVLPTCFTTAVLLTGCHHVGSSPGSSMSGGATVNYLSKDSTNGLYGPTSKDSMPSDPVPGEKLAARFFSSISSGNLAAANLIVGTEGHQDDPVGQVATEVKTHGSINDITFTGWSPRGETLRMDGTLTYADKKVTNFEVVENAHASASK